MSPTDWNQNLTAAEDPLLTAGRRPLNCQHTYGVESQPDGAGQYCAACGEPTAPIRTCVAPEPCPTRDMCRDLEKCCWPGAEPQLSETEYAVYRWEEGGEMTFERRLYIRHEAGQRLTAEDVREEMAAELGDFKSGKYRVIPVKAWVDVEVKAEVVLS
jgi:hypothetical protein